MTRTFSAALAAFILALVAVAHAAGAKAALITRVEGAVQIVRAGKSTPEKADLMKVLYVGDRVEVPAGAKVGVVVYSDSHRETADGKATLTVAAAGLQGGQVAKTQASRAFAGLQGGSDVGGARGAVTTRPADPDLPLREVLLAPDPTVRRSQPVIGLPVLVGEGTMQTIAIRDANGKVVHKELLTTGSRTWTPPAPLAPGDYEVLVVEENGNVLGRRIFTVAATDAGTDALLKDLAKYKAANADPEAFILASLALEEQGLTQSALEAAQVAIAKQPSASLLRWTSQLASRLGRLTEAAAWDRMADVMEGTPSP